MSLKFSDTTNYNGIAQMYEKELGLPRGYITSDTDRIKDFTAEVNLALDAYIMLAIQATGTWQYDDSNHDDLPFIKTNLVAGQRIYPFTNDGAGNLILDIMRVMILPSATSTTYQDLSLVDAQSQKTDIANESTVTGVPYEYDKTSNAIIIDPPSSYSAPDGLKIFINREGSYFIYTDTDKKPGVPAYHEYFYLRPAMNYARINTLASLPRLEKEVLKLEGDEGLRITGKIATYFGSRERDKRNIMTGKKINYI